MRTAERYRSKRAGPAENMSTMHMRAKAGSDQELELASMPSSIISARSGSGRRRRLDHLGHEAAEDGVVGGEQALPCRGRSRRRSTGKPSPGKRCRRH